MKKSLLIVFSLLTVFTVFGQSVQVKMDPILAEMLQQYTADNKAKGTVDGWRVQILATTNRQRLESVQQSFRYHYPNVPVDWEHDRPYYKLQAGAFRTKRDALRLKYILSREYEGLYLVHDDAISKGELLNYY